MAKSFDLIVFDWDGTLMDSVAKIVACFKAALMDFGLPPIADDQIRHIIGLGLEEALLALLPRVDATMRLQVADRYRQHFLHYDQTPMPLFPGVREGLERLQCFGFRLAVATGKARRGLDRVLRETQLGPLFCVSRCADETCSKPDPRMLFDILAHTAVAPERALMIGDTTFDLAMATAAGVPSLAVSYGVHSRARLLAHHPLACLDSFNEVYQWLTRQQAA